MDSDLYEHAEKGPKNLTIKFVVTSCLLISFLAAVVFFAGYYLVRSYNLQLSALITQKCLQNSIYTHLDDDALNQTESGLIELGTAFKKNAGAKAVVLFNKEGVIVWSSGQSSLLNLSPMEPSILSALPFDFYKNKDVITLNQDFSQFKSWSNILTGDYPLFTQQVSVFSKSGNVIGTARLAVDVKSFLSNALFIAIVLFVLVCISCLLVFYRFYKSLKKVIKTIDKQEKILNENVKNLSDLLDVNQTMRSNIQTASARAVELNEQFLRRVGADLHDGPAQMIGYANLRLSKVAQTDVAKGFGQEFTSIRKALEESLDEIRGISSGLVLPELETMTLEQCMRKVISIHSVKSDAKITQTYSEIPDDVPLPIKICAYRFVQEGLNNAERHGSAKKCRLNVRYRRGSLHVSVKDNGVGFRTSALRNDSVHLGLVGLKDRIESIGGTFQINSELGVGTAIKFTVTC